MLVGGLSTLRRCARPIAAGLTVSATAAATYYQSSCDATPKVGMDPKKVDGADTIQGYQAFFKHGNLPIRVR